MRSEGLEPASWSASAGTWFPWHEHGYHKVLYCATGTIVFHLEGSGDLALSAGDRMDLDAGARHAATAGPGGVTCIEAPRPAGPATSKIDGASCQRQAGDA